MSKEAGNGGYSKAEVDALIAAHAAIAGAHHAKYTDAEADVRAAALIAVHAALATVHQDAPALIATHAAIATAHQDAPGLIATHAAIAGAHHAKYTDAEADARAAAAVATHAAVGDVHALGGNIVILPAAYSSIGQGTWIIITSPDQWRYGSMYNSSHTDGDNISFKVYLPKGTYTLWIMDATTNNEGIADVDINGTEVASFDWYSASLTNNVIKSQASIAIATTGLYTLKYRVDGKNASSSDYYVGIQQIVLWRTA